MYETERERAERFLSEGALKSLFFSEWYRRSWDALLLDRDARGVLESVMDESIREDAAAKQAFADWQARMRPEDRERMDVLNEEMLHTARQGFLTALIAAKDASAVFFQKAALTATDEEMADRFAQLAARDYDHGMRLRKLLVDMFYSQSPMSTLLPEREGMAR